MTLLEKAKMSPDEFLVWEREQQGRHFYVRGEVFAMAGGSPRHNRLGARIVARLETGIDPGRCNVFTSDQKIGLPDDEFVYADAVVVCGSLGLRAGTTDVVTNPTVVVEVLSKSTEPYDRGDKQKAYLALRSIAHFMLVSQSEPRVELYTRQTEGSFRFDVATRGDVVRLEHVAVSISVDDLYHGVFELPGD